MSTLKYVWIKCLQCNRIHRDTAPHLDLTDIEVPYFPCYWKRSPESYYLDEPYLTMSVIFIESDNTQDNLTNILHEVENQMVVGNK